MTSIGIKGADGVLCTRNSRGIEVGAWLFYTCPGPWLLYSKLEYRNTSVITPLCTF